MWKISVIIRITNILFNNILKTISVSVFIADFNLLSCELDLSCCIESFYIDIILNQIKTLYNISII